ncbi:putative NAD-dependent protein deacetylase hst2-1 [Seiridium cardinale]|uniref:NAD-dependent protein deacetylase hst2-1 n=1 Tax=Seiridium cardinale TaxID=138064 RepID=A0ABR2XRG6_9PEZI
MGNENSTVVDDDAPTQTLESRDIQSVAKLIREGRTKRIVVMTGAGISTAAGIPDFRSPETGLYHNLARLNLPFAEAVFEIDYFKTNPDPFYVLAKELYPGKFHPTISHVFIALLAKKKLLRMLFTQNIDCLERSAGVPGDLIVEAHGSFATQRCVECKAAYPDKEMREHVEKGKPPRCIKGCGGLVKPDIVFFGEQLPAAFYDNRSVPCTADLMLVLGTSLTVHPFASLPMMAMEGTPRVLFNKERVGDMGTRSDDVICLGDCDSGVRKLAQELGWEDELEGMWRSLVGEKEAERQIAQVQESLAQRKAQGDEGWEEDEVERVADQVEDKLELSERPESGTGANQSGQIENEEAARGATKSDEKREEGRETTDTPTADSKSSTISAPISSDEDIHQKPFGNSNAGPKAEASSATHSGQVDDRTKVEESHEPASYSQPVVKETDPDEKTRETKGDGSVL